MPSVIYHLTLPKSDPTSGQIIWTQFNGDAVSHQDFDPIFPNFSADGCQDGWLGFGRSINFTAEHGIGEGFDYDSFDFDDVIFLFLDAFGSVFAIISLCPRCFFPMQLRAGDGTSTSTGAGGEGRGGDGGGEGGANRRGMEGHFVVRHVKGKS